MELEHVAEFLKRCGRHRLGTLFELAIYTGLRRGEVTGIHLGAGVDREGGRTVRSDQHRR
jgi:hypothetical protein